MGVKLEKNNICNGLLLLSLKLAAPFMAAFFLAGCNDSQQAEKVSCIVNDGDYSQVGFTSDTGDCNGRIFVKNQEYADSGVIARLDAYMPSNQSVDVNWVQIAGPEAVIVNPDDLNADVLVPYVQTNQALVFEVTVNDDQSTYTGTQIILALPLNGSIDVETPVVGVESPSIKVRMKNIADGTPVGIEVAGGTAREGVDYIVYRAGEGPWTVQDEVLEIPVDVLPCSEASTPNLYTTLDLSLPNGKIARINVVIDRCENISLSSSVSSVSSASSLSSINSESSTAISSTSSASVPAPMEGCDIDRVQENTAGHERVANPFDQATFYIDPDFIDRIGSTQLNITDQGFVAAMEMVKQQPTGIWLDSVQKLCGETSDGRLNLEEHIREAASQASERPMLMGLVVFNSPGRSYGQDAFNPGDFMSNSEGLKGYQGFIDSIASLISNYPKIRFAINLEPGVIAVSSSTINTTEVQLHWQALRYAIMRLSKVSNAYLYLDIAQNSWYPSTAFTTPGEFAAQTVNRFMSSFSDSDVSGFDMLHGVSVNVSSYTPMTRLAEFLSDFKNGVSEPEALGYVIDTSRNGYSGPLHLSEYWCNNGNAGLGRFPESLPDADDPTLHSYYWFKPPGESDGVCDIWLSETKKKYMISGFLENSPPAGEWFEEHFIKLIENAQPALVVEVN